MQDCSHRVEESLLTDSKTQEEPNSPNWDSENYQLMIGFTQYTDYTHQEALLQLTRTALKLLI